MITETVYEQACDCGNVTVDCTSPIRYVQDLVEGGRSTMLVTKYEKGRPFCTKCGKPWKLITRQENDDA